MGNPLAELTEAESLYQLEQGAPASMGVSTARLGGGIVVAMPDDESKYWTKAIGLGVEEPVTAELIDRVCRFFRDSGAKFGVLQLAPDVLPADWDEICVANGLTAGSSWTKLAHDLGSVPEAATDLRVRPIEPGEAPDWGSTLARGFGMTDPRIAEMFAVAARRPEFSAFGAWDGDELAGAGNLFRYGISAACYGAATLPEYRGRGAQSALLSVRLRAAQLAGCKWVFAETGAEAPGEHNPSLHNMLRAGFTRLYDRVNWRWTP